MSAASSRRVELEGDIWTVPAARYKTSYKSNADFELPLSRAALDVLAEVRTLGKSGFVFTTNGETPISGFSKFKAQFDSLMLAELRNEDGNAKLEHWTVHDLRRTARSLMTRAGVDPDHAERALGHVIGGVRGVYDRHGFRDEKRRALEALAALIERILNPADNVVALKAG